MTIDNILNDMKLCYDADYGTAGWYHPLHSLVFGAGYIYIRDTKTKEIFILNVHGYYHGYNEYEYRADAKKHLSGDYEYFDPIRVYGVSYLVPEQGVLTKETITAMYRALIAYHYANDMEQPFCGGSVWVDGYTDEFSFYCGQTQINVMSVKAFAYLNNNRRLLGAQSIPYNSQIPDNAIVIMLINDMDKRKALPEETDPTKAWSFIDSFFGEELTVIKMDIKKDYGHRAN